MRLRPIAALSTVAVSMLLLAGCAAGGAPEPTPSATEAGGDLCSAMAASGEASDAVTIEGETGQPSTPTFTAPLEVPELQVTLVAEGEGDPVEAGDIISYAFSAHSATTGEELATLGYEGGQVMPAQLSGESALGQLFGCAAPGQRVVATFPAVEGQEEAVVYIMDVFGTVPSAAWGEEQPPVDGMPAVELAEDGTPSVTLGDLETPAETQVATLKKGDGYVVQEGDGVLVQYYGVRLSDGEEFDSSWSRGGVPLSGATTGFVAGFGDAMVGQAVGSQVLAVIPPAEGYGEGEINETDLKGETLVFVIDILGAQTPPTQ